VRSVSLLEAAAAFAVGGSLLAVAVPAFVKNLTASKLSEPIAGLDRMVTSAVAYSARHPQEISFPPSAPLTPAEVPRGVRVTDPPEIWQHLTWRSLRFGFCPEVEHGVSCIPHAFSFKFDSATDPASGTMVFVATAHGDLDGDGIVSTFEVRGDRAPGSPARVLPGMFIDREVE
jgi:hypothetical protein